MDRQDPFNISEMTEDEAERLLQSLEARCIVLYRDEDGTLIVLGRHAQILQGRGTLQ